MGLRCFAQVRWRIICCNSPATLSGQHQHACLAQAQALRASLAVIRRDEGDARRGKPVSLIARFRAGVQDLPFTLADSCSAIQPLIVGDNSRALQLAEKPRQQGLLGHGDSPANRTRWYCATALNANRSS